MQRQDDGAGTPLLAVNNLHTAIDSRRGVVRAVDGVSLRIDAGETLGLVGESGCGKTMTAMSIVRLLPHGGRIMDGTIVLDGHDMVPMRDSEIRAVRGRDIGVVFQDPMTSLNPTMTIGRQIIEAVRIHQSGTKAAATKRAVEVLGLVGMPRPAERLTEYPHQLSGGMRQRAMIAVALACGPKLLIADEPTTALDVTIQAQILELLDDLCHRLHMGMLLVTHDMGVIAGHTDRVMVMYAGKIVESGTTKELFANPRHRYTEALLKAIPSLTQDRAQPLSSIPGRPPELIDPPMGCRFAPRCEHASRQCRLFEPFFEGASPSHQYACFHPHSSPRRRHGASVSNDARLIPSADPNPNEEAGKHAVVTLSSVFRRYPTGAGVFRRGQETIKAVTDVSFDVNAGETFGLVGESGCGKSTLGRLIVGMEIPDEGSILIEGAEYAALSKAARRQRHRDVQLVFQDSYSAMNPKMRVGAILRDPLRAQGVGTRTQRRTRVRGLIESVGLPSSVLDRYPHELSGGQRQRVGFARALTLGPKLIVADEPVSALDVSVQAQIINLMTSLQAEFSLTYIIISHDLSVVRYVADRIGVMYLGKLVEIGPSVAVYDHPAHPYTAGLLGAIPTPDPRGRQHDQVTPVRGELPSAVNPPSGCPFRTRCPRAQDRCALEIPTLRSFGPNHLAACHYPLLPPAPDTGAAMPDPIGIFGDR